MRRRALLPLVLIAALTAPATVTAAPKYPNVVVPQDAARPKMRATILAVNRWWVANHDFVPCAGCMVRPPGSKLIWTFYKGQGFFPNWVRAARDVLRHKIRGDDELLRAGGQELLQAVTVKRLPNGLRFRVMQSAYRAPDGQPAPWRDAMGNGLALTIVIPSMPLEVTPADMDRAERTAREFLNAFGVHWKSGGLMAKGAGEGRWYLEYAYAKGAESRVLNGFMQSLVSLERFAHQAELLAPNDPSWMRLRDRARDYVRRGVIELLRTMPKYDIAPKVSKYSLTRPGPAPAKYHTYHVQLLQRLEILPYLGQEQRDALRSYRERWGGTPPVSSTAELDVPPGPPEN